MTQAVNTTLTGTQIQEPQNPQMPATIVQIGGFEAAVGVAVVLVGLGVAWGTLKNSVSSIERLLNDTVVPDLKDVRERFAVVEDRVESLWRDKVAPAHSPRQLNEYGQAILDMSGIKEIITEKKETLLGLIREKSPSNAYDAEQVTLSTVENLTEHCPDVIDRLKDGAFRTGASIDTVLLVGGIYLRNIVLPELGFTMQELDVPKLT